MTNQSAMQERYLRDDVPIRLGGLATNLARIGSFSDHPDHREVVVRLLEESKFFVEWTMPDIDPATQPELMALHQQLECWYENCLNIWLDLEKRSAMAQHAADWSQRVLKMSGLLTEIA